MAEFSKIAWTDATFNPWLGCTKIAPECDGCYAEQWAKRFGKPELWHGKLQRTSQANWNKPHFWNLEAQRAGVRRRVFSGSLCDVFDNQADPEWRSDLFAVIQKTPWLDWLLLTKRPQNIAKMLPEDWGDGYPNVWLGTTAGTTAAFEKREVWRHLTPVPAVVHFVSMEPLLERVFIDGNCPDADWIIVGAESDQGSHKARPMELAWARSIRDECRELGIAFFMKQVTGLGEIPADLMVRQFPRIAP